MRAATKRQNISTFILLFNNITNVMGKLKHWQGKDSLKEKSYLSVYGKQKSGPLREKNETDIIEFLLVMLRLGLELLERENDLPDRFLCVSTRTVSRTLIIGYNVLI